MSQQDLILHYPTLPEVEQWIQSIWDIAQPDSFTAEVQESTHLPQIGIRHIHPECQYIKFTPAQGEPFYAYWQPAWSQPAPLLVHVPGYGGEMSSHPELVTQGYNVLHINPLGYTTTAGHREDIAKYHGHWPVLPDTVLSGAERGYRQWLANCIQAITWAEQQPATIAQRISFFGTSQGGGGALLLGSLYKGKGVRSVAADVPFLTNFPLANGRGAYQLAQQALQELGNEAEGWRALGFIDTLSHASRLGVPVLLTGGEVDGVTPTDTIETLFERLPGTRSYTLLQGTGHRYTREFSYLAAAWFRLYA